MTRILLLILLFSPPVLAQVDLTLGLRAYYPFSGNANDASGNNNNPVFNNATPAPDRFGTPNSAYQFNGTSQYLRIPNSATVNTSNQISICAWVKVSGFYPGLCHGNNIVMKGDADYLTGNYMLRYDDYAFTNGQNCNGGAPDVTHQNFYGIGTTIPPGGYSPFINTAQWFSVVYTYDGSIARIYVNCELKVSTPAAGLSFTNNFDLFLGRMNHPNFPYWFNGIMDEIRIYNRAINADEVKAYGDCLNLVNAPSIGGVINQYTPVTGFLPCENILQVEDAGNFFPNDTVLLIQMKGAVIDSANSTSFGTITDYRNAGHYEINYIQSKTGNSLLLKNTVTRTYDIPNGKVQLVRIPYYSNVNISSPLTCLPWDGSIGGVLVLNVQDTANLTAQIDVSGKGFRGGTGFNTQNPQLNCGQNNLFYNQANNNIAGQKGEGNALLSPNINYGKGAAANGGGGGLGHNSGGGGGSNNGAGGTGGYQLDACGNSPFDNRGQGGKAVQNSSTINRLFMGGGGGAGQADNPGNIAPDGGNGGGIAIIIAGKLRSNGFKIISNGLDGRACSIPASTDCHDGMGGGGAGGSVVLQALQYLDNTQTENKGGNGANMTGNVSLGGRIGPGGGGGGGTMMVSLGTLPANITNAGTGGINGVLTTDNNNPWGAAAGQNGNVLLNVNLAVDLTPFRPNIDSVRIRDIKLDCDRFDFNGLAYTNTHPVAGWQWDFGDGSGAYTQNSNHLFSAGSYTVKLVVTDINGCKDSTTRMINASTLQLDAGNPRTICTGQSIQLQASSIPAALYQWSPPGPLSNPFILNPVAMPTVTTLFYLTAANAQGCEKTDSVLITVRPPVQFSVSAPVDICYGQSTQLAVNGNGVFSWSPASSLSSPTIANPLASPTVTTLYQVQATDTACNQVTQLSTTVTVRPLPPIQASKSNDIDCFTPQSQLTASGGQQYNWSPAAGLSNTNQSGPVATPAATTQYIVTGTDSFGCTNTDSITVYVNAAGTNAGYLMPTGFTPNNDGLNDCYGIKNWGSILELEFSIYNRWGERVFFTRNPADCWNGKLRGTLQAAGVFVYMIKAKTNCAGDIFRKGTFVLIR